MAATRPKSAIEPGGGVCAADGGGMARGGACAAALEMGMGCTSGMANVLRMHNRGYGLRKQHDDGGTRA